MFCHKCGTQIADGSVFCQKCGAKQIGDNMKQQAVAPAPAEPIQQTQQQSQAVTLNTPKKKKSGKMLIGLGAAVIVIIVAIFIALNWNGKTDYVATVGAHTPFAASQGLPYTYEDVFDKYINAPVWEAIHESDNVVYVEISGDIKETDHEVYIKIKTAPNPDDPDGILISPESVTLDGENLPTQNDAVEFLLAMFWAYDDGYDDLSALLSSPIDMPAEQELSNELSEDDKWDIAAVWLHTHGITDYYMCSASELGDDDYDYEESDLYFEVSGDYGTLSGIISFNNNDMFITFPVLIDSNSGEWLKADIYPIADWYDYIWARRYDDYDVPSDSVYDNSSMEYSDPLEDYSELSGLYEGFNSSLSISIYSSQEEGETVIGNARLYVENEEYYLGEIVVIPGKDIYLVETDEGEEVLLDVKSDYGVIIIDLYVDGQYIDEYSMVEHYES